MTAKEAHDILITTIPGLKAVACAEYDTLFVFRVLPEDHESNKPIDGAFNDACSVNKNTRVVRDFKPFHIPVSEYKRGKEVGDYK